MLRGLKDYQSYSLLRITALSSPPLSAPDCTPLLYVLPGYVLKWLQLHPPNPPLPRRTHNQSRTDTMLPATAFLLLLLATSAGAANMRAMRTTAGGCAPPFTCVSIVDVPAHSQRR